MSTLIADIGWLPLLMLLVAAFVTSMIHGATGIAGGFLLAAAAAPILGVNAVVPVLSITLLISHASRALFNINQFDKNAYWSIVIPAAPCIVLAAMVYGKLSGAAIAFLLGTVVFLSIPLRRWADAHQLKTGKSLLITAGAVYGGIAGASIGPGMLLVPVLLGLGMSRQAFVATLAAIALTTNIVRASVFGMNDLLGGSYLLIGLLAGIATIPGAWIGRGILRNMTDHKHTKAVEWLVLLGGANFYWLGYRLLAG